MKKKILAMLTAAALCVGMLPSSVLADVEQPEEDAVTTETVMELSEMGEETEDDITAPESAGIEFEDEEAAAPEEESVMPEAEPDSVEEESEAEGESDIIYTESGEPDTSEDGESEGEDIADLSEIEESEIGEDSGIEDEDIALLSEIEYYDVSVTDLTLHQIYTADGGQEYDIYSFTPEADGMYFYAVAGDEVIETNLYFYDSVYGNIAWNGYTVLPGDYYGSYNYTYLPGGATYYIVVTNSGNYSGYQIAVDGIAKGVNAVSTDTAYYLDNFTPDVNGDIWFTFVPEETGDYSFLMGTDYRFTLMRPYIDSVTEYYYSTEISNNSYTVTLTAGETYYLSLYPFYNDAFSENAFLYVSFDSTYTMGSLEFNVPYTVEAGTDAMYTDGTHYDVYAITPEVDGIYWIDTAWPEDSGGCSISLASPSQSGQHEWQIMGYSDTGFTGYMGLNGGTTYYVIIQRFSDEDSGYTITWTGVRAGDNPIELDTQTAVTDTISWTDDYDGKEYAYKWGMYTYTPLESGLYTFYSDSEEYVTAVYWVNTYDLRPEQYYQGGAYGSITVYLDAGQTYFLEVYADVEENVNVWLTQADGAGMIQYFDKSADKASAGSGDKITYTMDAQVVVPQYTQLSGPSYSLSAREWTSEDFTIIFHDTLDEGLTLDPDSIKITYYRYGTPIELTNDNYDGNIVYTVSTDPDDGCSFEITVNLTEMYWTQYSDDDWYFGSWGFDQLEDSWFEVTYDAVLDDDVTPGEYDNTAYVSAYCTDDYEWPEEWGSTAEFTDVSATETASVETYGLVIYKYDSATWPRSETVVSEKPSWIPDETVPLEGAEFELYDADRNLLGTLVTDSDGCAYSTSMLLDGETVSMTFADGTQLFIKETKAPDGYKLDEGWAEGYDFTIEAEYAESDYWYWGTVGNAAAVFDVMIYKYADGVDSGNNQNYYSVTSRFGADSTKTYDVNYNNPLVGVEFTLSRETVDGIEYVIAYSDILSGGWLAYVITGWTTDVTEATTLLTDSDGYLEFENLPAGTYTLTETAAPDGYYQLSDSIVFTVDSTGWVTVESGPADTDENEYGNWITVANEAITGKLELDKTDGNGNNLSGAEFILGAYADYSAPQAQSNVETYAVTDDGQYEYYYFKLDYDEESGSYVWDENYWYDTSDEATVMTTGTDGTLKITNLMTTSMLGGTYFLIETSAPEGYDLLEDPIVFTVSDDFTIQIAVSNDQASMNDDGTVMTVVDEETFQPNGHLTVKKEVEGEPENGVAYSLGEEITWNVTVINDGNLTITDITVTDELTGDEWTIESLAPGEESEVFTASYTVTENDIENGSVLNVATAKGTSPDPDNPDVPVTPGEDEEPSYRYFPLDEEIVPNNDDEEDPDSWVKRESVNEYDAIEIEMSTILPKVDGSVLAEGDFSITFHNQLDTALVLDELESDFKVDINGQPIDEKYYEIDMIQTTRLVQPFSISDGCAFHVNVDLSALYNDGVIVDEDLGTAAIRVFFYVDLETTDVNGSYISTAWYDLLSDGEVVYTSDTSTVAVYTFEIIIDKYDTETDEDLPDATFGLYYDESCENAVSRNGEAYTATSDENGQAMYVGIAEGTYYLKELEAPDGYELIETPVSVTLEGSDDDEEIEHIVEVSVGNTPVSDETPEPDEPRDPVKSSDVEEGASVSVGDEITYTITYYNNNVISAKVTITDALDTSVDYVSSDPAGEYDADTHTVTWILTAEAFEEGSVQLTVKVNDSAARSEVDNTAAVQIGNADSVDTNTVVIPVNPGDEENPNPNKPGTGNPDNSNPDNSNPGDSNPDNSNPTITAGGKTGDTGHMGLWLAMLIAACALVAGGVAVRTRRPRAGRR